MTIVKDAPCNSRCGTLKNPHCSMAISMIISQNMKPFIGDGDVSNSVKNSRVGFKAPDKETKNTNRGLNVPS